MGSFQGKDSSTPRGSVSTPQESSPSTTPLRPQVTKSRRAWCPPPLKIPPPDHSSMSSTISSPARSPRLGFFQPLIRRGLEAVKLSGSSSSPHDSGNSSMERRSWHAGDGAFRWSDTQMYYDEYRSPSPSPGLSPSPGPSASVSPLHPRARSGRTTGGAQGDQSPKPWPLPLPPPGNSASPYNSLAPATSSGRSTPTSLSPDSSSNGMPERRYSLSVPRGSVESPQSRGTIPVSDDLTPFVSATMTSAKWQKGKLLGSGTFGNLYVGFNKRQEDDSERLETCTWVEKRKQKLSLLYPTNTKEFHYLGG